MPENIKVSGDKITFTSKDKTITTKLVKNINPNWDLVLMKDML